MTPDQHSTFEQLKALPLSDNMTLAIRIIRELDDELDVTKAQLLAVMTLYRMDMMREQRGGFNPLEFAEGLAKVMAAPK
jgi:hypothetical protein